MSNSNNKYKTLVSNTMLISLGTFGSKLLVFFMVRFYTSYLTPADYGTADLITQTANLLFPLISLGITDGVFRFAVDHTEQRRNIFSVGVYTILAGAVLLVAILPLLGLFPQFDGFLWLIALYTMCSCFHSLCAQFVRAEGHTALYAVQGMINTVLVIGLNVLFLVGLRMGITGYVLSVALADLACTLLLFVRERLWRQLMLCPGWAAAREMLAYSIPMIPTTVFWWITSVSDRYMVTAYLGVDANGIYAVSYKMPTILSLVSSIFMEAWQFSAVSEAQGSRREHIRFFSKVWCSFQSVMFLAGACIIAFAVPEIHVLTTEQYYGAWLYVPVLGMAHGLFRVRELSRQRLHGRKVQQAHVRHVHDRRAAQHRAQFPAHPVEARRAGRGHCHVRELFCRVCHPGGGCAQVHPVPVLRCRRHGKLHPADGADALHRPAASGLEDRAGSVHFAAAPA